MEHKEKLKYWREHYLYDSFYEICLDCKKRKSGFVVNIDVFINKENYYVCRKCFMTNEKVNKIKEKDLTSLGIKFLLNGIKKLEKLKDSQMKSLNKIGKNINSEKNKE